MQRKHYRSLLRWPFLVLLMLAMLAIWQQQAIRDWVKLHGYEPPGPVVQLADDIQLTPAARRMFYVNHPAIEDRGAFNAACSNRGEHTIVLGCYHPVDRGIFIFHVSDDRLAGVDQVTAAHEMLHVAYDRLSRGDRTRIDGYLQDYFDRDLQDARVKSIVAAYQKTVPNAVVNEMHSVFGTEIKQLPPELETYYKKYFVDRAKVVSYADDYQAEFTSRQTRVTTYDEQLRDIRIRIDNNTTDLETQESQITALRRQLDADRASGDTEAYNQNVPLYNSRIDAYNSQIASTKKIITSYNQMVGERNALALQVADLARSIDSSFQPISQN